MWLDWIITQHRLAVSRGQPEKAEVVVRTKDGREFSPFSIEWKDGKLILCENEEVDDG
ncbi:hypothetical protein J2J97_32140 (plasmid) [Rhizobium bangladeshense]|uniref:hypothetical protein n=1 Tax=Rhizobium bangladeshense TaxID=1138189 RepID=UPI001A97F294|nr:hypothetical protein [Rhizobium bangladeshense]QSY98557.1 hypothetical protein J2J97_32140 [Rhizobium bangladeshense]